MLSTWKNTKSKTSKFVDAEDNNWIEREGNYHRGMDRKGLMDKKNKNLGTERREYIDNLYNNKKIYIF